MKNSLTLAVLVLGMTSSMHGEESENVREMVEIPALAENSEQKETTLLAQQDEESTKLATHEEEKKDHVLALDEEPGTLLSDLSELDNELFAQADEEELFAQAEEEKEAEEFFKHLEAFKNLEEFYLQEQEVAA